MRAHARTQRGVKGFQHLRAVASGGTRASRAVDGEARVAMTPSPSVEGVISRTLLSTSRRPTCSPRTSRRRTRPRSTPGGTRGRPTRRRTAGGPTRRPVSLARRGSTGCTTRGERRVKRVSLPCSSRPGSPRRIRRWSPRRSRLRSSDSSRPRASPSIVARCSTGSSRFISSTSRGTRSRRRRGAPRPTARATSGSAGRPRCARCIDAACARAVSTLLSRARGIGAFVSRSCISTTRSTPSRRLGSPICRGLRSEACALRRSTRRPWTRTPVHCSRRPTCVEASRISSARGASTARA